MLSAIGAVRQFESHYRDVQTTTNMQHRPILDTAVTATRLEYNAMRKIEMSMPTRAKQGNTGIHRDTNAMPTVAGGPTTTATGQTPADHHGNGHTSGTQHRAGRCKRTHGNGQTPAADMASNTGKHQKAKAGPTVAGGPTITAPGPTPAANASANAAQPDFGATPGRQHHVQTRRSLASDVDRVYYPLTRSAPRGTCGRRHQPRSHASRSKKKRRVRTPAVRDMC